MFCPFACQMMLFNGARAGPGDCKLDCMVVRGGGSGAGGRGGGGGCTGGCCPCSTGTYTGDTFCNLHCVMVVVVEVVAFQH